VDDWFGIAVGTKVGGYDGEVVGIRDGRYGCDWVGASAGGHDGEVVGIDMWEIGLKSTDIIGTYLFYPVHLLVVWHRAGKLASKSVINNK